MKKQKIIIVSLFGLGSEGGVERVVYYLKEILENKYTIEILTLGRSPKKFDALVGPILLSFRLFFKKRDFVISQGWHVWPYTSDIVIAHGTTAGYLYKIPEEATVGAKCISRMERIAAKKAKHICAVSENCREELVSILGISTSKISVLNNFVDEHRFYPIEKDRVEEQDKLIILYSGRLIKGKGVDFLLKLANAIEERNDVKLHIASNDEENIRLFKHLRNTKVSMGLSISEMNDFYNSGDVLYFPTRYEGFSMVTLEALSCGIPVMGTKYAIPRELDGRAYAVRCDDNKPNEIIDLGFRLKNDYKNRKRDIHKEIIENFGKVHYKKKLNKELKNAFQNN